MVNGLQQRQGRRMAWERNKDIEGHISVAGTEDGDWKCAYGTS